LTRAVILPTLSWEDDSSMATLNISLPVHLETLDRKLLASLSDEPEEMSREDWDRLRARVRQVAGEEETPYLLIEKGGP
jgi:hypothetical protein